MFRELSSPLQVGACEDTPPVYQDEYCVDYKNQNQDHEMHYVFDDENLFGKIHRS